MQQRPGAHTIYVCSILVVLFFFFRYCMWLFIQTKQRRIYNIYSLGKSMYCLPPPIAHLPTSDWHPSSFSCF